LNFIQEILLSKKGNYMTITPALSVSVVDVRSDCLSLQIVQRANDEQTVYLIKNLAFSTISLVSIKDTGPSEVIFTKSKYLLPRSQTIGLSRQTIEKLIKECLSSSHFAATHDISVSVSNFDTQEAEPGGRKNWLDQLGKRRWVNNNNMN
jgi:hypothetical protein